METNRNNCSYFFFEICNEEIICTELTTKIIFQIYATMMENKVTNQQSVSTVPNEGDTNLLVHVIKPLYEEKGTEKAGLDTNPGSKATVKPEGVESPNQHDQTWSSIVPNEGTLNVKLKDCSNSVNTYSTRDRNEGNSYETILSILKEESKVNPAQILSNEKTTTVLKWKVNSQTFAAIKQKTTPHSSTATNTSHQSVSQEGLDEEPLLKIAKTEEDPIGLLSVLSQPPCVLKRTANNQLITANGGIILNEESPSPLAINLPTVIPQKSPKNYCPVRSSATVPTYIINQPIQSSVKSVAQVNISNGGTVSGVQQIPKVPLAVTEKGLISSVPLPGNRVSTAQSVKIINGGVSPTTQHVVPQTGSFIIKQEPSMSGIASTTQDMVPKLENGNVTIKQEPVTLACNLATRPLIPKLENGSSIIKQEPLILGINSTIPSIVPKPENGSIIIKQEPRILAPSSTIRLVVPKVENGATIIKRKPRPPKFFSHKSWNGLGSCGPANESQQLTTSVSVKRRPDGYTHENIEFELNVMCIRCKEIFSTMEALNDHLKKTKHGDVNSYFYSSERWREVAYKKRREILQACQGQAWVGPTPNHLSFGPVIPEDQLPVSVYKCQVCAGIYNDEREFKIHEAYNSCSRRKKLQESLLQHYESKPIDKALKPLL